MSPRIVVDYDRIADFCRRWKVAELSLFGSVLTDDFDPDRSDVDVLIEFLPDARITMFKLVDMGDELAAIFGRHVDLVPKQGLKPFIRKSVLDSSQVVYVAAA